MPAFADDAIEIHSTPAQIRATQDSLKRSIEKKEGDYADLSDKDRKAILDKQADIYRLIEGRTTIEELGPNGKIELANALESMNALLTKAEDSRMVCERVKVIGSNRPQNKCMSVGERKRLREKIQREGIRVSN
ncbi:MAG: hypothetical protein E6Q88_00065 [Lysobacteraceae bacterium]|nr:MAG: hypothetical protein E6Q88_00065 [Xanthomonadaceae bacterium]